MKALAEFARRHYAKLLALVAFLLLWQMLVSVFGVKPFIIPSPQKTFAALLDPPSPHGTDWLEHVGHGIAVVISFCVTAVAGVLVALLITWSATWRKVITRCSRC